jgi:hypothetical protein
MSTCSNLINGADKDGMFLNWIMTGDETWCFLYDPQQRRQLATWKSPSPRKKKPRQDKSKGLNCFSTHLELFTWNSFQEEP